MTCGIYFIKNLITNDQYVGQAYSIESRLARHIGDLKKGKHTNKILQEDFNKFGQNSFQYGVLEIVERDKQVMTEKEIYWWKELQTSKYNKVTPGYPAWTIESYDTWRRNISIALKGKKKPSVSKALKGRKRIITWGDKISKSLKGKQIWLGRHHSQKTKRKISKSRKGKPVTKEWRESMKKVWNKNRKESGNEN